MAVQENKNNVKKLRIEKGLTQKELAEIMHVHQTAVSQWENSKYNPDLQVALQLAEFFNVSVEFLLGQTQERNGMYVAQNIKDSNFVQGSGTVSIDNSFSNSQEEKEIIRIFRNLDVRDRTKLLNFAFDLEDKKNSNSDG